MPTASADPRPRMPQPRDIHRPDTGGWIRGSRWLGKMPTASRRSAQATFAPSNRTRRQIIMKISVVMPCHNTGPWIQQALQSVAAQTRAAHEIIVVNDSSTDDTVEQIRSSGIKVRFLDTRLGNAAAARNLGIKSAEAEWIAFLDGDDVWCSNHLDRASLACMPHDVACFSQYSRLVDGQPLSP